MKTTKSILLALLVIVGTTAAATAVEEASSNNNNEESHHHHLRKQGDEEELNSRRNLKKNGPKSKKVPKGPAVKSCDGDCVQLKKGDALLQEWCADITGKTFTHKNYQHHDDPRENDISAFEYFENAIGAGCVDVDASGTAPAVLWKQFEAACGVTTWRLGGSSGPACGFYGPTGTFLASWVRIVGVGLIVEMALTDGGSSVGLIRTWYGGQVSWRDWGNGANTEGCSEASSGHLQVREHEVVTAIEGTDCNGFDFELSWDHTLDSSGGNIQLVTNGNSYDGWTLIQMGQTFDDEGFTKTNCGEGTMAKEGVPAFWYIDTDEILDGLCT